MKLDRKLLLCLLLWPSYFSCVVVRSFNNEIPILPKRSSSSFSYSLYESTTKIRSKENKLDEDNDETSEISWQQFWKKDNTLSTVMSASFVAKDWIQSLPCAVGIADCDVPEKAKLPATAKGAGLDKVDVLEFLNLKRVKPLDVTTKPNSPASVNSKKKKSIDARNFIDRGALNSEDVEELEAPSWQDIWRKDNTMSTVMSASFVAKDWIQSLPCALGIADCDLPEKTKLPATARGAGLDKVDVKEVLHLKEVKPQAKNSNIKTKASQRASFVRNSVEGQESTFSEAPSWQDIWKKDNTLSTVMSTSFITKDWIKSLPMRLPNEIPDEAV